MLERSIANHIVRGVVVVHIMDMIKYQTIIEQNMIEASEVGDPTMSTSCII